MLPRTPAALADWETAMGYCCRCGVYAALNDAKMCGTCRDNWQPSGPAPADLGHRRQPPPSGA
jgi:hypothetical protein